MAEIIEEEPVETPEEEEPTMEESILKSIMDRLETDPEDTSDASYREAIMQSINSAIVTLIGVGVGPTTGFRVTNSTAVWSDLLGDSLLFECAKDYIYLRCKLIFDPPTSGTTESFNALMAQALNDCKMNAEFPPEE